MRSNFFPLLPSKDGICTSSPKSVVTGFKRGFSDTMDGFSQVKGSLYTEKGWMFCGAGSESQPLGHSQCPTNLGVNVMSTRSSGVPASVKKDRSANVQTTNVTDLKQTGISSQNNSVHAAKAQVVGWPPVRSFRTKTLATSSKNSDEVDGKPGPGALFVKVPMRLMVLLGISSESKSKDLLHGSEYVLTYEDKYGDWMLVGDVPWEMFIEMCKRLRELKSSDAIGLAPRATEKFKI